MTEFEHIDSALCRSEAGSILTDEELTQFRSALRALERRSRLDVAVAFRLRRLLPRAEVMLAANLARKGLKG